MLDTGMHDSDGVLLFSYDDYFFDLQTSSLFRWAWTFREVRLSGMQINWERFAPGDDRFNQPIRQWVLSVPFPLRYLFASKPADMGKVLGIVHRAIATQLIREAGCTKTTAQTGAVTLIQRFGSALNWQCFEPEYALSHAVSGWRLH
jgi:hypothetical protein